MKNILDIMKELGIEVPEDKTAELNKAVADNYKTVAEFDKKVARLEAERDSYKEKADTAEETLKGFDGVDVNKLNADIAEWKTKAENAEKDYQKKIADRDFEDALKTEMEGYKFSSTAAKNAVMAEIREKGLKYSDGKILGLSDAVAQIKEKDADAFVDEGNPPAKFTTRKSAEGGGKVYSSKAEIMKIKDAAERQAAIASNMNLFGGE